MFVSPFIAERAMGASTARRRRRATGSIWLFKKKGRDQQDTPALWSLA
ncbi:hypothetical protein [Sphingomonas sp. 66-10]|nr:hypothetical protein [Sphingomonas sp. 66-10]